MNPICRNWIPYILYATICRTPSCNTASLIARAQLLFDQSIISANYMQYNLYLYLKALKQFVSTVFTVLLYNYVVVINAVLDADDEIFFFWVIRKDDNRKMLHGNLK